MTSCRNRKWQNRSNQRLWWTVQKTSKPKCTGFAWQTAPTPHLILACWLYQQWPHLWRGLACWAVGDAITLTLTAPGIGSVTFHPLERVARDGDDPDYPVLTSRRRTRAVPEFRCNRLVSRGWTAWSRAKLTLTRGCRPLLRSQGSIDTRVPCWS